MTAGVRTRPPARTATARTVRVCITHLLGHAVSVIPFADLARDSIEDKRRGCVRRSRQKVSLLERFRLLLHKEALGWKSPNKKPGERPTGARCVVQKMNGSVSRAEE